MIDYRISSKESFTEKLGELVSMLEHTRETTLNEISNLSESELDYITSTNSNSIGSLLLHVASIEFVHQIISFENRDLNESELSNWQTALELGEKARNSIKRQPIEYYLQKLSEVRKETINQLKSKQDSWLFKENKWGNGVPYNNYYLWFHVMEDEINHRGQIRTIKRLLSQNN
jgi:uncharacterized damage-inducible protein DinB